MSARDQAFNQAFWQAVDDMDADAAKPIESYLRLVPSHERDELARMLADVLVARGPAPTLSATESEGYARTLAIIADVLGTESPSGIRPSALNAMRHARGIDFDVVVEQLAGEFEIVGAAGRKNLKHYYHRLEHGKLLATKLSNRLMEALARIFDIDVRDVFAGAQRAGEAPKLTAGPMGRGSDSSDPPGRPPRAENVLPDPEVKRVERLFTGGPDA